MEPTDRSLDEAVLAAWAPAGWGQIVIVLGQGVVIHKFVVSGKAAAIGIADSLAYGAGTPLGERDITVTDAAATHEIRASPFISKVLRNGVPGLLASPRKTLLRWEQITSAEYRKLALHRGRMTIGTSEDEYKLKFLQNTVVVGDPVAVFRHHLAQRFAAPASD